MEITEDPESQNAPNCLNSEQERIQQAFDEAKILRRNISELKRQEPGKQQLREMGEKIRSTLEAVEVLERQI